MEKWEGKFFKWFFLFLLFALLINIGTLVLIHEEPRRGIITFEMLKNNNFLQPTVLGIPYFKKPPLHEWITSLLSLPFGVSETTLRLPSAIAVFLTSLSIFLLLRNFLGERRALFSSLIYPTFFVVLFGYSTKCEPDTIFTLFVTLSILLFFYFFEKKREFTAWFLGYFFTSLALLTKGLPAVQFFFFFLFPYFLINRNFKKFLSINHLIGFLAGIFPFLLWLLSVNTDQAIKTLFSEVLSRAPGKVNFLHAVKNYTTYPFRFLLSTFPWSFIFLYYILKRKINWRIEDNLIKVFSTTFLLDILLYWVFPGSRLRYLMPALPLFSVILSQFFLKEKLIHKRAKEILRFTVEILAPLGIVTGVLITRCPSLILKETLIFLIFLYGIYFFFLPRFNFSYLVILISILMVILRGFYSSYYYPIAEYKYPPVRITAKQIAKDTEKYKLFTKTTYLQLCFYVEKYKNKVLYFVESLPKDSLFLSQKREGNVLKEYNLGKHRFFLCSYGIRSLRQ